MMSHTENSSDERNIRLQKLNTWKEKGIDPFPSRPEIARTFYSAELIALFQENSEKSVEGVVAGRIILKRDFGKAGFITLKDEQGTIQLYFRQDVLGDNLFECYKLLDLGDIVSASGEMFFTKHGEPTLKVQTFNLLTKALRPLPEKFHGLEDVETRYRKRYLDLIANPSVKDDFILRSNLVFELRGFLHKEGFLEVETPMMHPVAGGAMARPFVTHHNALDMELYLRIAPELYLKRLVVGGMHKVFEVNRNFRNEGIDTKHNPEFTMVEIYEAYTNWRGMADLFVKIMRHLGQALKNTTLIEYQGRQVDIGQWREISYMEALREKGVDLITLADVGALRGAAEQYGVELDGVTEYWDIAACLFDKLVEPGLIEPTIVYDYPAAISPLSKRKASHPELAERFEAYAFGMELSNGFSELNNPLEQYKVFEAQARRKFEGDLEAMNVDEDFIEALEQGLPPTGGIGIGIDRLVMLFADKSSIRDVILFPAMKPK